MTDLLAYCAAFLFAASDIGSKLGRQGHSLDSGGVGAVVVEIEVDMVGIFSYDARAEFAVGECEFLAGVVLQGYLAFGCCLFVAVGIGSVDLVTLIIKCII